MEPAGTSDGLYRALLEALEERGGDFAAWRERLRGWRAESGREVFSELVELLLRRTLPETESEHLVTAVLFRRAAMASRLGRDPGLTVAALDHVVHAERWLAEPCVREREALESEVSRRGHDPETGVLANAAWCVELDREVARARRDGSGFAVVLFEVRGAAEGFEVSPGEPGPWEAFARLARAACRDPDVWGRLERRRFALLAPATPRLGAVVVAHEVLARFAGTGIRAAARAGIACHPHDAATGPELLDAAGHAVARAWSAGAPRVVEHPHDRRSATRFPVAERTRFWVSGPGFGRRSPARGVDLSRTGVRIEADSGLWVGDAVEVRMELEGTSGDGAAWGGTGTVVRRDPSAVRPGSARLGIRFDGPVPAAVQAGAAAGSDRMRSAIGAGP